MGSLRRIPVAKVQHADGRPRILQSQYVAGVSIYLITIYIQLRIQYRPTLNSLWSNTDIE